MSKSKGASALKLCLITNPQYTPELGNRYVWYLDQFRYSPLGEQAREEIDDAFWDIREIVENAAKRAHKRCLTLVTPPRHPSVARESHTYTRTLVTGKCLYRKG
jgi:hypothetical protein